MIDYLCLNLCHGGIGFGAISGTCEGQALTYVRVCLVFVVGKLMELHGEGGASSAAAKPAGEGGDTGAKVERADGYEPPVQESV